MDTLLFLWLAWKTYKKARQGTNLAYIAATSHGVPRIAIFVGLDREAWRVTVHAIEDLKFK